MLDPNMIEIPADAAYMTLSRFDTVPVFSFDIGDRAQLSYQTRVELGWRRYMIRRDAEYYDAGVSISILGEQKPMDSSTLTWFSWMTQQRAFKTLLRMQYRKNGEVVKTSCADVFDAEQDYEGYHVNLSGFDFDGVLYSVRVYFKIRTAMEMLDKETQ